MDGDLTRFTSLPSGVHDTQATAGHENNESLNEDSIPKEELQKQQQELLAQLKNIRAGGLENIKDEEDKLQKQIVSIQSKINGMSV